MAEHLLHGAQVGASLEQMGRKRVAQEMGVDALRVEPRALGELAEDQEGSGPRQGAALRIEEELGPVAAIEVRPPAGEIAAQSLGRLASERHHAFLLALAERPHQAVVEVDASAVEADRLADAETGAVEQLDESPVAERARRDAGRRLDQPFDLVR